MKILFLGLNGVIAGLWYWFRQISRYSFAKAEHPMDTANLTNPIQAHFERLNRSFKAGKAKPVAYRRQQLKNLLRFLNECESEICEALHADLRKPRFEALTSEIGLLRAEIRHVLANLSRWTQTRTVSTPITQIPADCAYVYEPKGTVLILGPWNFPIQLCLAPLIGAIAAGNTVIIKPSELAPKASLLLAQKLSLYLDPDCMHVMEGDHTISQALLKLKFDHIFFTGSSAVGRIVMQEAAANLVPVTLELGGKCPCIVDESVDMKLAATRIAWGKFINSGQVCIAPDFVLVRKSEREQFVSELKQAIFRRYGANPKDSTDYGRIVSKKHSLRLQALLQGQSIVFGGDVDPDQNYVAPTLVLNPSLSSPLMQEEIFGPILPILEYDDFADAIRIISGLEKPLAIYLFSKNAKRIELLRSHTLSGAFCVNDTISHVAVPGLPFGGVGASGMGNYHGEDGFRAFSYKRALFEKSTVIDLPLRYAPYTTFKERIANWFLR